MLHLFAGLDLHTGLLLLLALAFVLFYEAINGFHDTANAVATVIYTRAMRSQLAVVMAAVFNFLGVLLGGLSVAYAIVHMLPTDLLLNMGSSHGLAMVFSMLLAAIIWNLGTWYFGLPASSSHTLIGAIIGIGLTNALMTGTSVVDALNIPKVLSIFGSLIVSPIVGLVFAGGLIFLLRRYWSGTKKRARIHLTPAEREKKDGKKKAAVLDAYCADPFRYRRGVFARRERWSERHWSGYVGIDWRRTSRLRGEHECHWLRNHPYP